MIPITTGRLDPRAWLLWALAASLPPLLGRNPFVLFTTLLAALAVRAVWSAPGASAGAWRGLIRLAAIFAAFGALFNLLTAHLGDRVIGRLPAALPLIGGALTLNSLVYGLLSGLALLTLVVVGATLGAALDWSTLRRVVPERLTPLAVAGSIAFAFIPQTVTAFREIREAQAARGHRPHGPRDLVPLVVPLLTGGLERAMTLAEALESRAFGTPVSPEPVGPWRSTATAFGLSAAAVTAYLLAVGRTAAMLASLTVAVVALLVAGWHHPESRPQRTRYRSTDWTRADALVAILALLVVGVELTILRRDGPAFRYEPYPSLTAPRVHLLLLASLALLVAPAFVAAQSPAIDPDDEALP